MDNKNISGGFSILLFLIFLVLKLCNVIDWSWWWVFSPLWIGFGVFLVVVFICWLWFLVNSKEEDKDYSD